LKLFLNSLPVGSYFNVLSFGSNHKYLYDKSIILNKKNLSETISKISSFGGDLGGTDLFSPLKDLISLNLIS